MINFPSSPTIGQTFVSAGDVWTWDGVKWTGGGAAAQVDVDPVQEAPTDGLQYGRQNSTWSPITATTVGILDVTGGGQYVRVTGAWQPLILPPTGIPEAPATGGPYARQSSNWLQLGPLSTAVDAPSGSALYARVAGAWSAIPAPTGISDAPTGGPYARVPGNWVAIPSSTGITDAPAGGPWARTAGSWVSIGTGTGSYLPLSGGSLSGVLTLSDGSTAASQSWVLANTASGSGFLSLSGGTMTGPIAMQQQNSIIGPAGSNRAFLSGTGTSTSAPARFGLFLASADSESGSNRGSNFKIVSYSDAGSQLATALTIDRASAAVALNANGATLPSLAYNIGYSTLVLNKNGSGQAAIISGFNNGTARWQMQLGNNIGESGSNVGSNFGIQGFSDSGSVIGAQAQFIIQRSTQTCIFAVPISNPSDRRLKQDIEPIGAALEIVEKLEGVYYRRKEAPEKRHVGLIAQDVAAVLPEVINEGDDGMLGVAYPNMVAVLVNAVRELSARVAALEAER